MFYSFLSESNENLPGIQILIKELDDVLLRDVGNKIKDSGKYVYLLNHEVQIHMQLKIVMIAHRYLPRVTSLVVDGPSSLTEVHKQLLS